MVDEFGLDDDGRIKTPFVFWWDMRVHCGKVVLAFNRRDTDLWICFDIVWDKMGFVYSIECFEKLNEYGLIWYLDWDTLWIVDESNRVAYETRQYDDWVPANGVFITHDMADWHATSLLELKDSAKIVTVPDWAIKIIK